jgi:ubiquinone/menaquinone biosynthesis C-methylase UbiE
MPSFNHFDIMASLYESVIRPADSRELRDRIGLPAGGALLDAGGGTGRVAQFLTGDDDPVVVADLSLKMLAQARRKAGLRPVCSGTERLPFPDGLFARIIMVDAFHHVCDQRQTAAELWRVLRPGGRLVIEEPDVRSFAVKLLAVGEKLTLMRSRFLSPPAIAELINFPDARVHVETGSSNAWIIAEKGDYK